MGKLAHPLFFLMFFIMEWGLFNSNVETEVAESNGTIYFDLLAFVVVAILCFGVITISLDEFHVAVVVFELVIAT